MACAACESCSNPRADELIFQSLMSTVPDISGQNMRVVRDKSRNTRESAVAHLLGLELPPQLQETAAMVVSPTYRGKLKILMRATEENPVVGMRTKGVERRH